MHTQIIAVYTQSRVSEYAVTVPYNATWQSMVYVCAQAMDSQVYIYICKS